MDMLSRLEAKLRRTKIRPRELVLAGVFAALVLAMLSLVVMANFTFEKTQHFTFLAQAFLQGKLYFLELPVPRWNDVALFHGHPYWPLGPFPAVLLMPFVYLFGLAGTMFYQGYLQFWLVLATLYLVYQLARRTGYHTLDCGYLSLTFFTSIFFFYAWAPTSYYMAHVVVVVCGFAALVEYLGRKRYWLLGLLCGLALATRVPAGFGILFFLLDLLLDQATTLKLRLHRALELMAPFVALGLLLLLYNYARFGGLVEQGYTYQIHMVEAARRARDYGLFSLIHLPGNLYYLLLSVPTPVFRDGLSHVLKFPFIAPNPWGMSIFVTSPYLVYLFGFKYRSLTSRLALVSVAVMLLPILLYYGIGFWQFGYRYALDVMPLLFWLLMREYRLQHPGLSRGFRWLILFSVILNLYLLATYDYAIPI